MDHLKALESKAVEKYLLGELSEDEREEFELHFFGCEECSDDLRVATLFEENARAVFRGGYMPRSRWRTWLDVWASAWRSPAIAVPACAALLLAGVASYQNGVEIPSLRASAAQAAGPQLTVVAILRGTARGADEEKIIEVPRGAADLVLQFDVAADPRPPQIQCDIQDTAGKTVSSSVVPVPANGTVALSVKTATIPPGAWTLVVHDPSSGAGILRYSFRYQFQ